MPVIPDYTANNAHVFYMVTKTAAEMKALIQHLKLQGITAAFHYLALHKGPFFADKGRTYNLPNADHFTDCLVRLPLYFELTDSDQNRVIESVRKFYA